MSGRDPLVRFYLGPDAMRARGWVLHFLLAPAHRLMREDEMGRLVLAALSLSIFTSGRLDRPLSFRWRSDATEISRRIALLAGQSDAVLS